MEPNSAWRNPQSDEMKSHLRHDEGVRAPPSTVCEIKRPSAPSPLTLSPRERAGVRGKGLCQCQPAEWSKSARRNTFDLAAKRPNCRYSSLGLRAGRWTLQPQTFSGAAADRNVRAPELVQIRPTTA